MTTDTADRALHREPPAIIAGDAAAPAQLRAWRDADRADFAAMNADPSVMRFFPALLTREQSDTAVDRFVGHHEQHGFGLWALEVDGSFAGFVGLATATFDAPFTPAVEIGWRLAQWAWGHGYASTAATRVLQAARDEFGIRDVVSFTAAVNAPSIAVMRRIGMSHDEAGAFEHPRVPEGNPLRPHVLYRWSADHSRTGIETVPR